jgi:hypothetical protein
MKSSRRTYVRNYIQFFTLAESIALLSQKKFALIEFNTLFDNFPPVHYIIQVKIRELFVLRFQLRDFFSPRTNDPLIYFSA